MKRILYNLLIVFLIGGCAPDLKIGSIEETARLRLNSVMSRYCLVDHSDNLFDGDTFVFCKEGRFDDQYLLVLTKFKNGEVRGIYNEVDKFNSFYNHGEDTLKYFSAGISFLLHQEKWQVVTKMADTLLRDFKDSYYVDTTDGTVYTMAYNYHAAIVTERHAKENYEVFSDFLIDTIIEPMKSLKRETDAEFHQNR